MRAIFQILIHRGHAWRLACLASLICCAMSTARAQETTERNDENSPQPIVVEPSSDPKNPTVRLSPDEPRQPWDPLEIGDFTLVDQTGAEVVRDDLLGKPWVASFIFSRCPTHCPKLAAKVHDLNEMVKDVDVRFVTITVDPVHDTPEKLAAFADIYEADPERWIFLTGEKAEVYKLIRHGFKVSAWENFGTDRLPGMEFAHSLSLVHVGPEGKVLGMYSSNDETEILKLSRVLKGDMETPVENRPVPPTAVPEGQLPGAAPPPEFAPTPESSLPEWAQRLPTTNAMLNGLAAMLLLIGFSAIKAGLPSLHKRMMLFAFAVSVLFLASYLTYHIALRHYTGQHGKSFEGTGTIATIYFTILISHVVLAAAVPVLALITIYRGLKQQWDRHRRIARVTFPIWLYVSVTGVIIYWMLYR